MSTKKKDTTPVQMTQRDGVTMILEKKTKKASPDIQAKLEAGKAEIMKVVEGVPGSEKLAELLATVGPKPPTVADLLKQADLASKQGYKALGLLEKQGRAVKASEDFYFDAGALASLEQAVRDALANGPASAADLKDAMGLSRKHAIPVLEHFDDTGVTRRVGDVRELAS